RVGVYTVHYFHCTFYPREDAHTQFYTLPLHDALPISFLFGVVTVGLVYLVATAVRGREPVLVLVLAGVVLGALAGAIISLLKVRSEEHTSELQSRENLVCRLLLEKKNNERIFYLIQHY